MLGALSTSITNLVSLFAQSLKLSALFPALWFIVLNQILFSLPQDKPEAIKWWSDLGFTQQAALTLVLTVLIGYTINVINIPIIRFFEGYPFRLTWWGRILIGWQRGKKRWLEERTRSLAEFLASKLDELPGELPRQVSEGAEFYNLIAFEYSLCRNELDGHFPERDAHILPTALGNTIKAFEEYPAKRYGIDAINMWSRLLPILAQEKYAIFVEREKSGLDFLLNLSLLIGVFAVECTGVRFLGWVQVPVLFPILAFCAACFFYQGAITCALNWGESVKVAFDSYRYQLADHLALKPVYNMVQEKARWEGISGFIKGDRDFGEFDYPLPKKLKQKDEEGTS